MGLRPPTGANVMRAMLDRYFVAHPRSVNESYFEHAGAAFRFGLRLFGAGVAALVHALIPCLFEKTASSMIQAMHGEIVARSEQAERG
jgi:hypothetical protein